MSRLELLGWFSHKLEGEEGKHEEMYEEVYIGNVYYRGKNKEVRSNNDGDDC